MTGREPESSAVLSAWADSAVKLPEMETSPSSIWDWTAGAELTTPSSTMAIRPLVGASSRVTSEKVWAPAESKVTLTT